MISTRSAIDSLPTLYLHADEWKELTSILYGIMEKTNKPDEILSQLNTHLTQIKFSQTNVKILSFVSAWLKLTDAIMSLNIALNSTWADTINKDMTPDDLLPLTIEILPNDNSELQAMYAKLEMASNIELTNERGYYLTTLCSSIFGKIEKLKNNTIESNIDSEKNIPTKEDEMISKVAEEFQAREKAHLNNEEITKQVILIANICNEYKDYLSSAFLSLFQSEGNNQYLNEYTKNSVLDKDAYMDRIDEEISVHTINPKNPILFLLLQKYFIVTNFCLTLAIPATSTFLEFSKDFFKNHAILNKNTSLSPSFTQQISSFFSSNKKVEEADFINRIASLTQNLYVEINETKNDKKPIKSTKK
jgi:hypothetical protein